MFLNLNSINFKLKQELSILESLVNIRNRLTALKKDRKDYIKSSDVQSIYSQVIKLISKLNDAREDVDLSTATPNRVDTTLDDVIQLLSLFFLTIGKNKESPATYCQLATIRQLLSHLDESGVYTQNDLQPFQNRLSQLSQIINKDREIGKHPDQMTKFLLRRLEDCERIYRNLVTSLSVLDVELVPIHQRLVTIRRQLAAIVSKDNPPQKHEIKPLLEELRKIDSKRQDGKFLGPGGSSVPPGQAILVGLLEECFEIVQDVNARRDDVAIPLKPIFDRLTEIRMQLERLVLTHRWTLRETDLWNYQLSLQEIDKMRIDGKWVDSDGNQPGGQFALLYLLRRCHGLLYRLISSSEPISEELMPISNKLLTVKKCLNEVLKHGNDFTPRDLYPYHLALYQIDNLRKDGKFYSDDGSVPEGQAIVSAHLEECHALIEQMQEGINSSDDDEDDEEEDDDNSEEILEDGLKPAQPFPTHSPVPPSVTLAPPTSTLASLAIRSNDSGSTASNASSSAVPPVNIPSGTTHTTSMDRSESTSTSLDTATASQPDQQ
ncbi:hypothetical protein E3P92_02587 [Wallemia ichthyophaga]|nr:hypothetical protein E3P96_00897 [Wallemia ichthyophaga]TIB12283.1 hypothetical protein E3P92_02587 [Wallemia ichthyophaga]TIB31137.1 hypothetical protein E3P85_02383 [Wallemia ichthyophaga]TIB32817.1 hypothetical protein E3P84_02373 [Wallemia ichthyophaga]TIB41047.1 hypothetical protein E3P83_02326 [Wallemia ichthyophaga]